MTYEIQNKMFTLSYLQVNQPDSPDIEPLQKEIKKMIEDEKQFQYEEGLKEISFRIENIV